MVSQFAGFAAPAGAGPARGVAGVVVPAVCGACAVVGGLGVLGGAWAPLGSLVDEQRGGVIGND